MNSLINSSDFGEFEEEYLVIFYFYVYLFKKIYFIYEKIVEKRKYCFFGNSMHTISVLCLKVKLFQTILIIIQIVIKANYEFYITFIAECKILFLL